MKVYDALADAFVAEGTRGVFTMMGDANMYWLNALAARGVSIFDVRHEGAGLAMADGWARATGQPGICSTTSGPGTAQLATTAVVAGRAHSPVVAFCGDVATGDATHAQRFDQERFSAAVEAAFVRVDSPDRAHEAVSRAFAIARRESRPVILSAPEDVQQLTFAGGGYVPTSLPGEQAPDPDLVAEAARLVSRAERPIVLLGRGALLAEAGDAAVRIGDRTGAMLATTLGAKNWLAEAEFNAGIAGGYGTTAARALFRTADCVIVAGASMNEYTTDGGALFEQAAIVQFDTAPAVSISGRGAADCYVRADARLGLEALAAALAELPARGGPGFRTPEVARQLAHAHDDPAEFELEPGTLDPRDACRVLDALLPREFGLVLGSGHQVRFPTMLLRRPRRYVIAQHHFGCIGQGLTTAIGAVLATRNAPAFTVEGDAGLMMHLAEFETAVRYGVPLLVVAMNDQALGAEYHKSVAVGLTPELSLIGTPDLGSVGRALGGGGALVRTLDELEDGVAAFVASPVPTILDVRISKTVLSIPYRRHYYDGD